MPYEGIVTEAHSTVPDDEVRVTEVEEVPTPLTTAEITEPAGDPVDGELEMRTGASVIPVVVN